MEKEQNLNPDENKEPLSESDSASEDQKIDDKKLDVKSPEEKILELEDKLARTFAEMENQRRRFEKEKEEAFEYGGFAFAKEALNLKALKKTARLLSKIP